MTTPTKTSEFKRAPLNLSHVESELSSLYAMVAMVETEEDDEELSELRMVTRRTTRNMQIETGDMILMISSPRDSIMLLGLRFWAIGVPILGSILILDGVSIDGSLRFVWGLKGRHKICSFPASS